MPIPLAAMAAIAGGGQLIGSYMQQDAARDAQRAANNAAQLGLTKQLGEYNTAYDENSALYDPYMSNREGIYQDYREFDPTTQVKDFEYGKTIADFLDPSMDFQRQRMEASLAGSAAASGGLYSGAAMKELQDRATQLAQTDYSNSFNRMTTDKNQIYKQYTDNFTQRQANTTARANQLKSLVGVGTGATNNVVGMRNNLADQRAGIYGAQAQGNANMAYANEMMGPQNIIGGTISGLTSPQSLAAFNGMNLPYLTGDSVTGNPLDTSTMPSATTSYTYAQPQRSSIGQVTSEQYRPDGMMPFGFDKYGTNQGNL